ncbi:hypothetical protein M501DRAFT_1006656 [Patellaria atrata CBS 101060]|uniref:GDP-mannose transporter n=1 Tax=Patellaria atrata CBS 101060 TaxID=1346257 RepID=A0A9P4S845_9PEZI|nr:hypothetical protein M501DRAFT_1006656 [Patellaria atrata CBS 101060]
MNRPRPFNSGNPFKPAIQYLSNISKSDLRPKHSHYRDPSLDDTEFETPKRAFARTREADMESRSSQHSRHSSGELQPGAIPLIDFSRSPSPFHARSRSAATSEDEDDFYEPESSIRPLVRSSVGSGSGIRGSWKRILKSGGLGSFLFGTWLGWQIYVTILVLWFFLCGFGLLIMNRLILATGVYKIPYPLIATLIQLSMTHSLLVMCASLTRMLAGPLRSIGMSAVVAPSQPTTPVAPGYRGSGKGPNTLRYLYRWFVGGNGGIAGGGIFEFDRKTARQVLPLAAVYIGKVLLSNISFTYSEPSTYTLARIGIVPLSIILTSTLNRTTYSIGTLSSALTALLNLLLASVRSSVRVNWESIVAGVFSSAFTALYPILLLRTYRALVSDLVPQGDILTGYVTSTGTSADEPTGSREETRAYWRTLHYTSLLSLIILTPLVLIFGELHDIIYNCYVLDVPFFWFLNFCGAIGSVCVFASTLLLVKATSPLTVTFIGVPRAALQLVALNHFKMPVHSWVGISMCWACSVWFVKARREEGRVLEKLRLEGR